MRRIESNNRIYMTVMTGLMVCMILVTTSLFKVPVPFSQGYVHLGDSMIFLAVLLLGHKNGAMAAGVGSALGDLLGGFAMWAPFSFIIKFLMAYLMGAFVEAMEKRGHPVAGRHGFSAMELVGMILAGVEMTFGYFLVERMFYGNWAAAAIGIPWNIGQFALGCFCCVIISEALYKTPLRKYFANR